MPFMGRPRLGLLVGRGEARRTGWVFRLGRIGFDNVAGHLEGGMGALANRDDLLERTERVTAPALAEWLAGTRIVAGGVPVVVDVRTDAEYAGGHIAGSLNDEVGRMPDYMIAEFQRWQAGEPLLYQVDPASLAARA